MEKTDYELCVPPYFKQDNSTTSTASGTQTFQSKLDSKENYSRANKTNRSGSGSGNVIAFIELDDSESELSITDEPDCVFIDDKSNSKQKEKNTRREIMKEKVTNEQDQSLASSAIDKQDKSETIPGLGSPPPPPPSLLETKIDQINETSNETINQSQLQQPETMVQPTVGCNPVDNAIEKNEVSSTVDRSTVSNDSLQEIISETNGTETETKQIEETNQQSPKHTKCIRVGCFNSPIDHTDWDSEYCSSSCAVEHCKSVFLNWLPIRQLEMVTSTTPTSTTTSSLATI